MGAGASCGIGSREVRADGRMAVEPTMDPNDVGVAVANMANLPLSTNVLTMTIMATKMPFVGRGQYNLGANLQIK